MEIARIVILDGSLLREDRDEYIAAGSRRNYLS